VTKTPIIPPPRMPDQADQDEQSYIYTGEVNGANPLRTPVADQRTPDLPDMSPALHRPHPDAVRVPTPNHSPPLTVTDTSSARAVSIKPSCPPLSAPSIDPPSQHRTSNLRLKSFRPSSMNCPFDAPGTAGSMSSAGAYLDISREDVS